MLTCPLFFGAPPYFSVYHSPTFPAMSRILNSLFGDSRSPFPLSSLSLITRFTPRCLWSRLQKSLTPLKSAKPDLCLIPSSTSTIGVLSTKWSVANFATLGLEQLRSPSFAASPDNPAQFRLFLYPRGDNATSEYVSLFVEMLPNERADQVSAFIKLLIEDGNGGRYVGGNTSLHTFTRGGTPWGYHQFIKRKELFNPHKHWLPNDTLEISCEILFIPPCSVMTKQTYPDYLDVSPKPESIETYEEWLNDASTANVVFLVGETVIPANKYILAKRSTVLRKILEETEGNGQIEVLDTEGEVFQELINYLYTGKLTQLKIFAEKLLPLASKYQISDLKSQCEAHLCSVLSPENVLDYYELAEATKAKQLRFKAIDYMRRAIIQSLQGEPSLLGAVFQSQILQPYLQSNWLQKELLNRRSRHQARTLSTSHLWRITNFHQLLDRLVTRRFPVIYSSNFGPSSTDASPQFHLELHPRGVGYLSRNYLSLYVNLATSKNIKERVQFAVSIIDSQGKKVCTKGNERFYRSKVVKRGRLGLGCKFFVKRSTLLGDRARYLPKNTLSILVEMKILSKKTSTDCSKKLELGTKKWDDVIYEPSSWLDNEKLSDVLLLISGEEEKPIWAYKIVLARGSPVFAAMFKVPMRESAEGRVTITEEDRDAFKQLLCYLYTGKVGQLKGGMASRLLIMADKYQVDSLKDLCQEYLSSTVCLENALELLEFAKLNNVQKLKAKVIEFIQKPTLEAIKSLSDSQLLLQLFTKLVLTSSKTTED